MKSAAPAPVIFIVDDDDAVRESLRLLLKSQGHRTIGCSSAQQFLDQYDPRQPGCAVLDVRMPGMSGLELQDELNRRGALIPVIFITGHGDVPMAVEAMGHGAFHFLEKPFREDEILGCVRRALDADARRHARLADENAIRTRLDALTPRERDVLRLLVAGKPNKIMAADLGLSQRTVEIHRAHLMEKMAADSLAHLVRMAMIADLR